jgi:outer membrane protein OmpA-like peptidoglycan-associated protein
VALKQYAEVRVEIAVAGDASGTVEERQKLTRLQAEAIVDELVRLGVARERLQARGAGPDGPVCEGEMAQCGKRQVEAIVLVE